PSVSLSFCDTARAMMSTPPPGANPTATRTGRFGYDAAGPAVPCAHTTPTQPQSSSTASAGSGAPRRSAWLTGSCPPLPALSRPVRAGAQGCGGLCGLLEDFAMVERRELAGAPQDAPVDDHRVHVARLRERNQRLVGIAHRSDIDIAGAYQDDVGPLAGCQ